MMASASVGHPFHIRFVIINIFFMTETELLWAVSVVLIIHTFYQMAKVWFAFLIICLWWFMVSPSVDSLLDTVSEPYHFCPHFLDTVLHVQKRWRPWCDVMWSHAYCNMHSVTQRRPSLCAWSFQITSQNPSSSGMISVMIGRVQRVYWKWDCHYYIVASVCMEKH